MKIINTNNEKQDNKHNKSAQQNRDTIRKKHTNNAKYKTYNYVKIKTYNKNTRVQKAIKQEQKLWIRNEINCLNRVFTGVILSSK